MLESCVALVSRYLGRVVIPRDQFGERRYSRDQFFFASLFSFELDVESEPCQIVHPDIDLVVGLRARMF